MVTFDLHGFPLQTRYNNRAFFFLRENQTKKKRRKKGKMGTVQVSVGLDDEVASP